MQKQTHFVQERFVEYGGIVPIDAVVDTGDLVPHPRGIFWSCDYQLLGSVERSGKDHK